MTLYKKKETKTADKHRPSESQFTPSAVPRPLPPLPLSAFQRFVSGDDSLVKLDHESGALVPVYGHLGREATVGEDGFHDAPSESCTVEGAVLLGYRDEGVDEGVFLNDVVGLVIVIGLLQLVCLLPEQGPPHRHLGNNR